MNQNRTSEWQTAPPDGRDAARSSSRIESVFQVSLDLRVGLGHGFATTNLINAVQHFATPYGSDFFIRVSWNRVEKCLAKATAVLFRQRHRVLEIAGGKPASEPPAPKQEVAPEQAEPAPNAVIPEDLDLVILNGRVMDLESQLDAVRNVGMKDGKIVAVTEEAIEGP